MNFEVYDLMILPLIVGLVELVKKLDAPDKILPLVALALGITAGVLYIAPDNTMQGILTGIALGLSASGLYSAGKTIIEKDDSHG